MLKFSAVNAAGGRHRHGAFVLAAIAFTTFIGQSAWASSYAQTQTTLTYSGTDSAGPTVGESITLQASVGYSGTGGLIPARTVSFYDGATKLGDQTLTAGAAPVSASLRVPASNGFTDGGTHNYYAVFNGCTDWGCAGPSTSATVPVMVKYLTKTAVTVTPVQAYPSQTVTVKVSVAPTTGSTVPNGSINILDQTMAGTTTLASNVPLTNGQAIWTTTSLPSGPHQLLATYVGNATYVGSSSLNPATAAQVVVNVNAPATILDDMVGNSQPTPILHGRNTAAALQVTNSAMINFLADPTHQKSPIQLFTSRTDTNGNAIGFGNIRPWFWLFPGPNNTKPVSLNNTAVQVRYMDTYVLLDTNQWVQMRFEPSGLQSGVHSIQSDGSVSLSIVWSTTWKSNNPSTPETGYLVQWHNAQQDWGSSNSSAQLSNQVASYIIRGLQPGQTYYVRVIALYNGKAPNLSSAANIYQVGTDGSVQLLSQGEQQMPSGAEESCPATQTTTAGCTIIASYGQPSYTQLAAQAPAPGLPDTLQVVPSLTTDGSSATVFEIWPPNVACNSTSCMNYPEVSGHIKGIFASAQARLVKLDTSKSWDNGVLANSTCGGSTPCSEFYAELGYDIYQTGWWPASPGDYGLSGSNGRMKKLTSDWQAFNVATITNNNSLDPTLNPSPPPRLPALSSGYVTSLLSMDSPGPNYIPNTVKAFYSSNPNTWAYNLGTPFDPPLDFVSANSDGSNSVWKASNTVMYVMPWNCAAASPPALKCRSGVDTDFLNNLPPLR